MSGRRGVGVYCCHVPPWAGFETESPSSKDAEDPWQKSEYFLPADTAEPPEATLSPMSIDSATSADTTLDMTGDVTVEDVKDFLG